MYQIGDKVVHPMYGAGVVESIVQKTVDGVVRDYYILQLPNRSMVVMVPTENCEEIGVRPVVDEEQADKVLAAIPEIQDFSVKFSKCVLFSSLRLHYSIT